MNPKFVGRAALVAAGLGLCAGAASASVIWSASAGGRAASAEFSTSGGDLFITLTNSANADAGVPTDILTGVFFDISGSPISLAAISCTVPAGSGVFFCGSGAAAPTDAGGSVGGEWAYKGALSGAPHSAKYGVSSSGLGLFGPGDLFGGTNLQGPSSPDGVQYGITTAGDNLTTGNGGLSGEALIKNKVVIKLNGVSADFNLNRISNVSFQYGTDLSETNLEGNAPTPGAVALLGLSGLIGLRRRR